MVYEKVMYSDQPQEQKELLKGAVLRELLH
jgi:hypothetical protein